ncbi:putative reverse transcriptase zinc-binding domain-containing protein [Helianthus annuus]|uniref:uncharacterized protein LOC110883483 n=1 Tax=Helianthus annuus TaxID=4232 RepID=UPI000B8F519D|nr:uncharacterized protein LOC110883483 [Helianthus annuus]KAJ0881550.1 putative reverse transcriptase zinc-binding domain-containing protein [Helianthus annuus]
MRKENSLSSVKVLMLEGLVSGQVYVIKKCNWVPAKCRIFAWRAELDRIPIRQVLVKRSVAMEMDDCVLCGEEQETVDLFTACSVSLRVWNQLSRRVKLPPIYAFSFRDLMEFYKVCGLGMKEKEVVHGLVITWCIWKVRNDKAFSNGRGDSESIFGNSKALGFLWLKCRSKHKNIVWKDWCKFPLYML